ncbi:hypothetical protein V865_001720 [Kwoniella europaea PYCC6329]|uniref:Extradiol ring-cleavage dioxygenase class III enzyme subunit B domain-containing protein n=1 Tax=Kwoniella europaea PYCC6329 TaxID=1423913 RepID=A0AAX4KBA5_9TREE
MDESNIKGDVYFISHGGPVTGDQKQSEPYKAWQSVGRIIQANPPKGIVIVSAHWENHTDDGVLVNSNRTNPVIYDFYNFPKHFYSLKFQSHFDRELEDSVLRALNDEGIRVGRQDRGLDHGIWIAFRAMFGESTNIPIIQVSLPSTENPLDSVKLGKALGKLRGRGYTIVGSGQGIHNVRDLIQGRPMPYSRPFLSLLQRSISSSDPISSTLNLIQQPLYRLAHPSDEHFFPLFVSLGAVDPEDKRDDVYMGVVDLKGNNVEDQGLGWCLWRWKS